jgi:pyruvate dehydrogenase E2 component (dihydrolipoyllysine-residue acetyltransferase)
MAHAILMPRPGQMTEECTVISWHKAEGDPVHRGDVLFEIETDKSTMEVEAFDEGVMLRIVVPEGATVPVNAVCAWVGESGESGPDIVSSEHGGPTTGDTPPPSAPQATVTALVAAAPATPSELAAAAAAARGRLRISPRARRLAAGAGVDPRGIAGTGPEGRITERDVLAAVEVRAASVTLAPAPVAPAPVPAPVPAVAVAAPRAPAPADGDEPPRPLSRMRRVIAERLTLSATTIPAFTVTAAVDVTDLLSLRRELKVSGVDLSMTDYVLTAVAQGLVAFPDVNARTDGVSVWPRRRVHLGLAVSVPAGLLVPVIRDADRLSVHGIHAEVARLAAGARAGRLSADELAGSTFTVSNLGMFGVDEFTAIINPGESGILAVGSAQETPAAIHGGIAVRSIMKLTLTADHRLVDGELGARFLNAIRRRLEDHRELGRDAALG